jgi:hypothetical protein
LALDFFMNMPVAVAAATIAWKVLPESVTERRDYWLDPIGMVTLLLTVVSLIVDLQQVARSVFGAVPLAVAVGSVLFLRWLNYHGLSDSVVPPYTEWETAPGVFVPTFRSSWAVIAGLAIIEIVTSAMRERMSDGKKWNDGIMDRVCPTFHQSTFPIFFSS